MSNYYLYFASIFLGAAIYVISIDVKGPLGYRLANLGIAVMSITPIMIIVLALIGKLDTSHEQSYPKRAHCYSSHTSSIP